MHPHCFATWESHSTKNPDENGEDAITESGSMKVSKHCPQMFPIEHTSKRLSMIEESKQQVFLNLQHHPNNTIAYTIQDL